MNSEQLCERAGITYRQLDFWARQGYLGREVQAGPGSGVPREWTGEQVRVVMIAGRLLRAGFIARRAVEVAQQIGSDGHADLQGVTVHVAMRGA